MHRRTFGTTLALILSALLLACGGGSADSGAAPANPQPPAASADVRVLMMGNSHTSVNALPDTLQAMLAAAMTGRTVAVTVAPGWMFLDERLADIATLALLQGQRWTHVVLQAQKYSSSGQFEYSTAEAAALIRLARSSGALPVLFPEWPRRGVNETARIFDLHVSIALAEPACVAPVGQAFDLAAQRHPALVLHAGDGNHSAPAGAFLAALMLYATLSGNTPLGLPALDVPGVDAATQALLRAVAADTVLALAPRRYC